MAVMVFDVGGSEIKYCVMDDSLERGHYGSVPTPLDSREHFFQVLENIYRPFAEETEGIALSLPGIIDSEKGVCRGVRIDQFPVHIAQADGVLHVRKDVPDPFHDQFALHFSHSPGSGFSRFFSCSYSQAISSSRGSP